MHTQHTMQTKPLTCDLHEDCAGEIFTRQRLRADIIHKHAHTFAKLIHSRILLTIRLAPGECFQHSVWGRSHSTGLMGTIGYMWTRIWAKKLVMPQPARSTHTQTANTNARSNATNPNQSYATSAA